MRFEAFSLGSIRIDGVTYEHDAVIDPEHVQWCAREKPMFCAQAVCTGVNLGGGHAEHMLAYADATILLPDALAYEQAAPIFCAGYTVWSGLRWAEPQPAERVAVVGIGGLGHLAVQFAKAAGFTTPPCPVPRTKTALSANWVPTRSSATARHSPQPVAP